MANSNKLILVTGATGYVGGRLVPRLLDAGYRVRVLVRDSARLQGRLWLNRVEVVTGDALTEGTLTEAMKDVSVAYYLIHGKQGGQTNADRDLTVARNFAHAAEEANIERIIYFGELVDPTSDLSPYLRSRHETGYILRYGGTPVTEFRASLIIGCGSMFFEMIRVGTERVPLMFVPRWVFTPVQPIAVSDVVDFLVAALSQPESAQTVRFTALPVPSGRHWPVLHDRLHSRRPHHNPPEPGLCVGAAFL